MGLFDELKKITNDINKELEKSGVKDEFKKFGKEIASSMDELGNNANEFIHKAQNSEKESSQTATKELPVSYKDFPAFSKDYFQCEEKKTDKYTRLSMDFNNVSSDEINAYIQNIISLGYVKASDVRFEKGNTYIIVDPNGYYDLNLVFHIKK